MTYKGRLIGLLAHYHVEGLSMECTWCSLVEKMFTISVVLAFLVE